MLLAAALFVCTVPTVHDGDNVRCGDRTMRLAAIDAPDFRTSPKCRRHRPGAWCDDDAARQSRDHLRRLVGQGTVQCTVVDASPFARGFQPEDRYGRPVVRCAVAGHDLSSLQLRAKMAHRWP